MTSPAGLQITTEIAFTRIAAFAVELLDPMTMQRVSDGVTVDAVGVRRATIRNELGLFVWVNADTSTLTKVSIQTGTLPYENMELTRAQLRLPPQRNPLTSVQLVPALSYSFAGGVTVARGTLVEDRTSRTPVVNADVRLQWLDDDGITWRDTSLHSHTTNDGDFVSVLRLTSTDVPLPDASGAVSVRLRVLREGMAERGSVVVKLPQGRVADSTSMTALLFAWDELLP